MSQGANCPRSAGAEDGGRQLQKVLNEALDLADSFDLAPEIGARLQEIIDLVQNRYGLDRTAS
jgi:hypothetical protein